MTTPIPEDPFFWYVHLFMRTGKPCLYDIILWDLDSKQSIGQPLKGHTKFIIDLNFSSDGSILTSVGSDTTIREWDVNLTSWQSRVCRIANRNLTVEEWERFLGADVSYGRTCPDLPPGN